MLSSLRQATISSYLDTEPAKRAVDPMAMLRLATGREQPAMIYQLPAELLSEIFDRHKLTYKSLGIFRESDAVQEQQARARAPFRLAAVCRTWRKIALADARLWTTIHIPRWIAAHEPVQTWKSKTLAFVDTVIPAAKSVSALEPYRVRTWEDRMIAYIDTALARSCSENIDFTFALIDKGHNAAFRSFFLRLSAHAHRWRSVSATFAIQCTSTDISDLVRWPTPELRALNLELEPRWALWPYSHLAQFGVMSYLLPHAPKLESLALINIGLSPQRFRLVHFSADIQDLTHDTWEMIKTNQESLQTLMLAAMQRVSNFSESLHLSNLKELTIGGTICVYLDDGSLRADFVMAPQLEVLVVEGARYGRAGLSQLISANSFDNLRELRLCDLRDLHWATQALTTLRNLRRLQLSNCTMPDELIARMCVTAPTHKVIWPHLEVLVIGNKIEQVLSRRILTMARLRGPGKCHPWANLEVDVSAVLQFPKRWKTEIAGLARRAARLRSRD